MRALLSYQRRPTVANEPAPAAERPLPSQVIAPQEPGVFSDIRVRQAATLVTA